jgi:hypothetical protein
LESAGKEDGCKLASDVGCMKKIKHSKILDVLTTKFKSPKNF